MTNLDPYYADIETACKRFNVKRLEIFGSSTRGDFDLASDIDVLVEFNGLRNRGISDRYFGLAESLAAIFKRNVDLVEISAIKNPYFREQVDKERMLIYGS